MSIQHSYIPLMPIAILQYEWVFEFIRQKIRQLHLKRFQMVMEEGGERWEVFGENDIVA